MTTFFWPYDANSVSIAGSFNDWKPQPLAKAPNGFFVTLHLAPGTYQYKFVVDGRRWCYDVMRPVTVDDQDNRNNTVVVGGHHPPAGVPQDHQVQHSKKKEKEEKAAHPPAEEAAAAAAGGEEAPAKGKGKGKGQQPQQQPKKEKQQPKKKEKQEKPEEEEGEEQPVVEDDEARKKRVENIAKGIISTVKSYAVPFYVGDVDCQDSLDDVISVANQFHTELPSIGCMFLSGGTTSFIVVAVVPEDKTSTITASEWVASALEVVPSPPSPTGSDTLAHAVVAADPDKGVFPIKLKDLSRGPTFAFLRKKGLVQDEEEDDEMYFLE